MIASKSKYLGSAYLFAVMYTIGPYLSFIKLLIDKI